MTWPVRSFHGLVGCRCIQPAGSASECWEAGSKDWVVWSLYTFMSFHVPYPTHWRHGDSDMVIIRWNLLTKVSVWSGKLGKSKMFRRALMAAPQYSGSMLLHAQLIVKLNEIESCWFRLQYPPIARKQSNVCGAQESAVFWNKVKAGTGLVFLGSHEGV